MAELFADLPTLSQATSHCFTLFTRQILGINKFASLYKKKIKKNLSTIFPFLSHCLMTGQCCNTRALMYCLGSDKVYHKLTIVLRYLQRNRSIMDLIKAQVCAFNCIGEKEKARRGHNIPQHELIVFLFALAS